MTGGQLLELLLGTSAVALLILSAVPWLLKRIVSTSIDLGAEALKQKWKSADDQRLEEIKTVLSTDLQKTIFAFGRLHGHRDEMIAELFARLLECSERWDELYGSRAQFSDYAISAVDETEAFLKRLRYSRLYFTEESRALMDRVTISLGELRTFLELNNSDSTAFDEGFTVYRDRLEDDIRGLERHFQKILNVE